MLCIFPTATYNCFILYYYIYYSESSYIIPQACGNTGSVFCDKATAPLPFLVPPDDIHHPTLPATTVIITRVISTSYPQQWPDRCWRLVSWWFHSCLIWLWPIWNTELYTGKRRATRTNPVRDWLWQVASPSFWNRTLLSLHSLGLQLVQGDTEMILSQPA